MAEFQVKNFTYKNQPIKNINGKPVKQISFNGNIYTLEAPFEYYTNANGNNTVGNYSGCTKVEEIPAVPQMGDIFVYKGTEYRYRKNIGNGGSWSSGGQGWGIRYLNLQEPNVTVYSHPLLNHGNIIQNQWENNSSLKTCDIQAPYTGLSRTFFKSINLEEFVISDDCIELSGYAFRQCDSLRHVHLGRNSRVMRRDTFQYTFPERITVSPDNDKYYALEYNLVERDTNRLIVPNKSCVIPEGVEILGEGAFESLKAFEHEISLPSTLKEMERDCLRGLKQTNLTLPNGLLILNGLALSTIRELNVPNSVTKVGNYCFNRCQELKSVIFGSNLQTVGDYAFYQTYGIVVDFSSCIAIPNFGTNLFKNAQNFEIRVPADNINAWKTATNLAQYADHIVGV